MVQQEATFDETGKESERTEKSSSSWRNIDFNVFSSHLVGLKGE